MSSVPNSIREAGERTLAKTIARPSAMTTLRDCSELTKLRVTSLIVMTAWTGFYFGAQKAGLSSISWSLFHALLGIGLVSSGAAAMNEVLERECDALMRRTANRPLPAGRMGLARAIAIALLLMLGGAAYLSFTANLLTGLLSLLTAAVYLAAYTPLKKLSPLCTFVGAFPGAMPPVLGWTAIRGRLDLGAVVLFAILFLWQFPHFLSIAWLYREDYQRASIRMRPVVESDGVSTSREIVVYSLLLIPVSLAPSFLGMSGRIYLGGALVLSMGLFWYGARLARLHLPATSPNSKKYARRLLRATVIYLPLLFALMMINVAG